MGGAITAGDTSGPDGGGGRVRFGRLLADALKRRGMKQDELAGLLGTTQSSVSGWINGKYEPAATTVFRIERALALEAGHLSRPLGYLPLNAVSTPVGVEDAILQSGDLADDEKDVLVALYHVLAERRVHATGPTRVSKKPAAPARGRRGAAPTGPIRPRSVAGSR